MTDKSKNNSAEKINLIFEYCLKEATSIIAENPLYGYLPNDIDHGAAFGKYFGRYVKHNNAHGFRVFDDEDGKWVMGEIADAVVKKLVEWLARQRFDFREILDDPDAKRYAKEVQSARSVTRIFEMLKDNAKLKKLPHEFNPHKHIINMRGVARNLKTGEEWKATPEDFFTKSAGFRLLGDYQEALKSCPDFIVFMMAIMRKRQDLCEFLMTFLGYCLTGEMTEAIALFLLGLTGSNGKSTLINLLKWLLGDYCIELPDSVIFKTNNEGRFDFADIEGARLAVKSDVPLGVTINAGNFKNITGGDCSLRAERKFRDSFIFTPECKLIICCNNKPRLTETGGAMERRIALIPFEADFRQNPDKHLLEKLLAEGPAILTILAEYARRWYEDGLPKSETIEVASREYLLDEDQVAQFIAEKCKVDSGARVERGELYEAFSSWLGKPVSKKTFKERLVGKGFDLKKSGEGSTLNKTCFFGLRLLQEGELF